LFAHSVSYANLRVGREEEKGKRTPWLQEAQGWSVPKKENFWTVGIPARFWAGGKRRVGAVGTSGMARCKGGKGRIDLAANPGNPERFKQEGGEKGEGFGGQSYCFQSSPWTTARKGGKK